MNGWIIQADTSLEWSEISHKLLWEKADHEIPYKDDKTLSIGRAEAYVRRNEYEFQDKFKRRMVLDP